MAIEEVRSFIAIELPAEIKSRLGLVQAKLKSGRSPAKWVAPEGIHLTLKFLGNISASSIPEVASIMEEAVFGIAPFKLRVRGLGAFPDTRRVRVVWVGLEGVLDDLISLQRGLDLGLEKLGFARETRPFTAHLTLARMRDEATSSEREAFGRMVAETGFDGGDLTVESISLMKSQLSSGGAIYSRLLAVPLTRDGDSQL